MERISECESYHVVPTKESYLPKPAKQLTRFDDLVIESDGEAWAYVCDAHMDISQYPIVGDAMADGSDE
jgi:sugar lactone lactonase YvrE